MVRGVVRVAIGAVAVLPVPATGFLQSHSLMYLSTPRNDLLCMYLCFWNQQ